MALSQSLNEGLGLAIRAGAAPLLMGLRWAQYQPHESNKGLPAVEWDWKLVGKAAMDEAFLATELVTCALASIGDRKRIVRGIHNAHTLFKRAGWLGEPASYHRAPVMPTISGDETVNAAFGRYRHLRFASDYTPPKGVPGGRRWLKQSANLTTHAWLYEHADQPRPWLVCVPGYRMGHPLIDYTGFRVDYLHRVLGLNVAIPVMPLHGPRCEGRRGGDGLLSGDFIATLHAHSQGVWDVRRLLLWLRSRGAEQIGLYGVSLGGYNAALVSSLEHDLECVIAGIPASDMLRLVRTHFPRFVIDLAEQAGFPFEKIEAMLRVVSPFAFHPKVPRDRRFLYAGVADRLASPDHARDLWHHWQRPRLAWYEGSHISFFLEPRALKLVKEAVRHCGW